MKFNRIVIPLAFCVLTGASFVGCTKEKIEIDAAAMIQSYAGRTFTSTVTDIDFGYGSDGMLITGNRKKLYQTQDYGVTWTVCTTFTGSSAFVDQLRYTNTGTLPYIVYHQTSSANAQMFTNVTGGTTWLNQIISNGNTICHSFYNSSSGYAYIKLPTYNYCLAHTTDFGDSYTYVCPAPVIGPFLQFTSSTDGYAITDQNDFSYTTNSGISWTTSHYQVKSCTKVSPAGTAYIIGLDNKIFKSIDFGHTWNVCFSDPGGNYFTTIAASDNGLVIAGSTGQLLFSRDGGTTWRYIMLPGESSTFSKLLILGDGSVIGTMGSGVSKYIIP